MPKLAPYSAVLKQEFTAKTTTEIPTGNWFSIYFDAAFPLIPDVEGIDFDQTGTEITDIAIFKDRVRVKLNQAFQTGKKITLKLRPKRLI